MVIASSTCWLQLLPIFSILDEHILKPSGDNFVHFQFLILGPKSSIGTQSVKYQTSEGILLAVLADKDQLIRKLKIFITQRCMQILKNEFSSTDLEFSQLTAYGRKEKKKTCFQTLHSEIKINFWLTQAVPQNLLAIIPVTLDIALSFLEANFLSSKWCAKPAVCMHVCMCVSLCLIEQQSLG